MTDLGRSYSLTNHEESDKDTGEIGRTERHDARQRDDQIADDVDEREIEDGTKLANVAVGHDATYKSTSMLVIKYMVHLESSTVLYVYDTDDCGQVAEGSLSVVDERGRVLVEADERREIDVEHGGDAAPHHKARELDQNDEYHLLRVLSFRGCFAHFDRLFTVAAAGGAAWAIDRRLGFGCGIAHLYSIHLYHAQTKSYRTSLADDTRVLALFGCECKEERNQELLYTHQKHTQLQTCTHTHTQIRFEILLLFIVSPF